MRLDLELVEVFCCVFEEGGFSKAAARLRTSQPTVSGHIRNLESYIGARLFDRLPRRIAPTRAGHILYEHGRVILQEKQAAIQELMRLSGRVEGEVEISASTIPGEYILPRLIASFNSSFPGIRVEMQISDSMDVCEKILSGSAEIGFAGAKIDSVGVDYRLFASDELVLVAPNNAQWKGVESVSLAELARLPFIAREAGSGTRLRFEKAIGCSVNEFNVVGRLGSTNAVKEAVKAGAGVSVLSFLSVKSDIADGALKTVRIDNLKTIHREFHTVVNRHLTLSPVAEAFLDWVFECRAAISDAA